MPTAEFRGSRFRIRFPWLALGLLALPALAWQPPPEDPNVLRGHESAVLMGVFAPESPQAVTVSTDHTVRLWDLTTRQELRSYPGHTGPLFCVAISRNGRTLGTGSFDNTLRIWDVPLVKPVVSVPAHPGTSRGLALSLDGKLMLTGGGDKVLRLWSPAQLTTAESGKPLPPATAPGVRSGNEAEVVLAAIRNDNNLIAAGDSAGEIRLFSPLLEAGQGTLGLHPEGLTGLAFHGNNSQLISCGKDGVVRLWQLPVPVARTIPGTGIQEILTYPNQAVAIVVTAENVVRAIDLNNGQTIRDYPPAEGKVTAIAMMPNTSLLAVATDQGKVQFWNAADGAPRGLLIAHSQAVRDVIFHADNQTLSTAGAEGSVRRWRIPAPDATEQAPPLNTWDNMQVSVLSGTPDNSKLLAGTQDGKIQIWKLADGTLERTLEAHQGEITALQMLPNSQHLFSGGVDKTLRQWNPADGVQIRSLEYAEAIRGLSITTDSQRLLTFHDGGRVNLVEVASGARLQTFTGPNAAARGCWLNDNQTLVTGSTEKMLQLWRPSSIRAFSPHQKPILDLAVYNSGNQVVTVCGDSQAIMSEVSNGLPVRAFAGITGEARVVACRVDNQRVAVGSSSGQVFVYNAGDAQLVQTLKVPGEVVALAFSPDNQKLAVATKDKALHIFGPPLPPQTPQPGNELVLHQQAVSEQPLTRLLFDRESRHLWGTDAAGNLAQWAYASPVQVRVFGHGGAVYGVALSRDGNTAVSCSADQTVRIWDILTGQQKAAMNGHQGPVHAVALSPDESLIVSSGADRTIRLWDMAGGRQLKQLATFDETMYSVAFHPDGKTVAVAGADRKIHLINVLTGAIERNLEGHTDYIHCVTYNPAGNRLLSYGYAGQLRVWDPTNGNKIWETRVGRVGNFAHYASDGTRVLLSNGDGTARILELPPEAR